MGTIHRVLTDNGGSVQMTTDQGLTAWIHKDSLIAISAP